MNAYNVFITLLIPNQISMLLGKLVQDHDYVVSKTGKELYLSSETMPGNILAITVQSTQTMSKLVMNNIIKSLECLKISFVSIVVQGAGTVSWAPGKNFNQKKTTPRPSHLKLVKQTDTEKE